MGKDAHFYSKFVNIKIQFRYRQRRGDQMFETIATHARVCALQGLAEHLDALFMEQNSFETKLRWQETKITGRQRRERLVLRYRVWTTKRAFWTLWRVAESFGIRLPKSYRNFLRMSNPGFRLSEKPWYIPNSGF